MDERQPHTYAPMHQALRRVHTNALKCALDQITSNNFEPIHIHSVHTLVTESEFDYG